VDEDTPMAIHTQYKSVTEVHDAYDRKILSPIEFVRDYLTAMKSSGLNAYLTISEERALAQAKQADTLLAQHGKVPRDKKPLFGIPMAVKDNLVMDGVRTTAASKMLENYIPPYTATVVQRLENAGAITLGKTNLDEFAMGGSNENSAFGAVKNPDALDRVAGGSSGGSAAAVRAQLCQFALGSDTGGSIRLPASYCGVVGLKPSYGRVSRYGLIAFGSSLDQVGPMTQSVEDASRVLDVMSGFDERDATSSPAPKGDYFNSLQKDLDWSSLKIGVPKEYFAEGLAPDVEKSIRESLKWFETKGAKLVPISLPHSPYSIAVYYIVAVSEASTNLERFDGVRFGVRPQGASEARDLEEFYKKVRANFGPEVKRRIILGTFALSAGYSDAYYRRACQVRNLIKMDFDEAFKKVDVIMGPVAPSTAYKIGEKSSNPLEMYLNDLYTIPANLAGLPGISVPCGKDSKGLSIGLQMMSPIFTEAKLLRIAHGFEKERASS
jgi:aspartyl-tRNA(Asn)/glutamyl-tRNA(Gln) amidotransferase subunit A